MWSSRHWNVERHVKLKHCGEGDIIRYIEYMNLLAVGAVPAPTYPEDIEGQIGDFTSPTLENLVDKHLEILLEKEIERIDRKRQVPDSTTKKHFTYECSVCNKCLSLHILAKDYFISIPSHCDPLWLSEYPELEENRRYVYDHLQSKKQEHLIKAIKKLSPNGIKLFLIEMNAELMYRYDEKHPKYIERAWAAHDTGVIDPSLRIKDPVKKVSLDYQWFKRAFEKIHNERGITELSDGELLEFIEVVGSSTGKLKYESFNESHYFAAYLMLS